MANSDQTQVELLVNGKQAEQELQRLRERADSLKKSLEDAYRAGNGEAAKHFKRELGKTTAELRKMESGTEAVRRTMLQLNKATPADLNRALKFLTQELKNIERGSDAWNAQVAKIKQVKAELDKVNSELKQSESLLTRMKNKINDWGAMAAGGVAAMSGLVMAGKKAVQSYAEMEQEMANVRKYTGMTAEEVEHLNEAFKHMDTRTSREGLNQLAQEAGRLGLQSEEDVLGFVKAADKINVALDDLGEGATLTLSKLTDIFGDKQRLGVEQSLLSVGSVINELSQNSTASAPYLAEFAQRLAGVGAQAHMTIPEIMGFGAVLDSQGQKLEMSSTALSKVIMNLFKDPAKIANATGLAVEEFSETCKRSTNEGLLMLLDRLHELGGIDSLAPVFADMGENGARASAVLAALAGNVEEVRKQQEAANVAFQEATSIDEEFNVQNNTVQAGLEKARKRFNEMAVELGQKLMPVMRLFHSTLSYTMKAMSIAIDFIIKYRKEILIASAAVAGYKVAVNFAKIVDMAWTVAKKAATAAQLAFNAAVRANPLGLLVGGIAAAGAAIFGYASRSKEATEETEKLTAAQKRKKEIDEAVANVNKSVEESYGEQIGKVKALTQIVNDNSMSLNKRREAINELRKIVPNYHASLTEEGKLIHNNTQALDEYYASLKKRVRAEKYAEALEENARKQAELEMQLEETKKKAEKAHADHAAIFEERNRRRRKMYDEGKSEHEVNKADKKYMDSVWRKREQLVKDYTNLDHEASRLTNEIKKYQEIADQILAKTKEEEDKAVSSSGKRKQFDTDKDVEEWKKKQDSFLKIKLAKGEIDQKEYERKMLELEVKYQGNLMSVLAQGSKEYLAANAARLEAKRKLEELDDKSEIEAKRIQDKLLYLQGELSHKAYTRRMLELDVEEKDKRLKRQKEGTQSYLEAQAAYLEAKKKLEDSDHKDLTENYKKIYQERKAFISQQYADGELSNKAYHLALEEAELDYLDSVIWIYKEGSEERLKAEKAYADKSLEYQNKHKLEAKKIQEDLVKSYFKKQGGNRNKEGMNDEKAQLEIVRSQLLAAATTAEQKLQIEEAYQKARYEIAKKYNDEAEMMAVNSAQATVDKVLEYMKTDGFQGFYQSFNTLVSGMGEIFSGLSSLMDAEVSLQTAEIEKKYEAEIEAAGKNEALVAQIEEKKQAEIAAVKNEAEEKKYGMQVASAVAQTAISAINAYSSASAIPVVGWIMGPIAAAMAVAAGGIQIATLKKERDAAMAQGYASGGYTVPGSKYQPAGIVHAGEWVASQELLANPTAAATIAQLDQAQRTNSIGQLDRQQVSASVSAPVAVAQAKRSEQSQPDRSGEAIDRLNQTLDNGIYAATTMTGDKGIQRQQRKYDQLMRNKGKK